MISELDVLRTFYTTPRMTRDLDIVISLGEDDVGAIVRAFESTSTSMRTPFALLCYHNVYSISCI